MAKNKTRILIIILMVFGIVRITSGDWKFQRQASIRNADKFLFRITRDNDEIIRAWLYLPKSTPGAFKKKRPIYQVDNKKVRIIPPHGRGTFMDPEKKKWIAWRLTENIQLPSEELLEIMDGKEITFQYYLPDGAIHETTFTLENAKEVIEKLLN